MTGDRTLAELKKLAAMMVVAFFAGISCCSAGPIEDLYNASPQAAALLWQKAPYWRRAPQIVKDRLGFMIFTTDFPKKKEMSIDDMTACIDKEASSAADETAVQTLVNDCAGLN